MVGDTIGFSRMEVQFRPGRQSALISEEAVLQGCCRLKVKLHAAEAGGLSQGGFAKV